MKAYKLTDSDGYDDMIIVKDETSLKEYLATLPMPEIFSEDITHKVYNLLVSALGKHYDDLANIPRYKPVADKELKESLFRIFQEFNVIRRK